MISKKCKYAIRAILLLAVESSAQKKMSVNSIAESLKIPSPYLGKILQDLVPKNIISSAKGPNGGFYLTGENRQTSIIRIIEVVDGLAYFESCGLGLAECTATHPCPIHDDFKKARDHLKDLFQRKSVEELATEIMAKDLILVR